MKIKCKKFSRRFNIKHKWGNYNIVNGWKVYINGKKYPRKFSWIYLYEKNAFWFALAEAGNLLAQIKMYNIRGFIIKPHSLASPYYGESEEIKVKR
jgi:hypothetical protein